MYKIEINQITESKHQNDGTFLQTPFWCQFKSRHGWTYRRFNVNYTLPAEQDDNECTKSQAKQDLNKSFELAVLNRSFAKGLFSIAYIPLMPELPFECTPQKIIDQALDVSDNEENYTLVNQNLVTPETQTIEMAALLSELGNALKVKKRK